MFVKLFLNDLSERNKQQQNTISPVLPRGARSLHNGNTKGQRFSGVFQVSQKRWYKGRILYYQCNLQGHVSVYRIGGDSTANSLIQRKRAVPRWCKIQERLERLSMTLWIRAYMSFFVKYAYRTSL